MIDPYATLGVDRNADAATVKRAFRRKAQRAHPDRKSGNASEFRALVLAKDILTDAERRARFDRFGNDDRLDEHAALLQNIAQLLQKIIEQAPDIEHESVIAHAQRAFRDAVQNGKQSVSTSRRKIKRFENAIARLSRKDGGRDGIVFDLLSGTVRQMEQAIERAETEIRRAERSIEILAEYDYRIDERTSTSATYFCVGSITA